MAFRLRRIVGVLVLVFFSLLAISSFLSGITLDGKEHPSIQCLHAAPRPDAGGPFLENAEVSGVRTFLPLGVTCTYDSPDDAVGPQTVQNANWPATVIWMASSAAALYGGSLAFRSRTA